MSAITNVTIPDSASTPVNHIFTHASHSKDGIMLRDSTAGLTTESAPTIELTRLPSKSKSIRRVRAKVVVPVMDTIAGNTVEGYVAAPRKAGQVEIIKDFVIFNRATEQAIGDAQAYMSSFTAATGTPGAMARDLINKDLMAY